MQNQKEIVINKRAGKIAILIAAVGYVVEWITGVYWLFSSFFHAIAVMVLMVVLYVIGGMVDANIKKR